MKNVVTVTGEVPAANLGYCQCHEHILLRRGRSFQVNPALCLDDPEKSKRELEDYRKGGGRSLVDAQPVGCGRMAGKLHELSGATGVKIIASTGFHKLVFYPEDHWIHTAGREWMAKLFIEELLEGMYDDGDDGRPSLKTSFRAGQIKTALDTEGLTPRYQRLFGAAADAAKVTGAPLMVHVEIGTDPRPLLKFLQDRGVLGRQMIFCHMDRACGELSWHRKIADAGVFLEYDTIGRFKYHSDEREIEIIREMLSQGLEDRLLFSLDTTRQRLKAYGGQLSLNYLLETFLPKLEAAKVGLETLKRIMTINPGNAMSWREPCQAQERIF